MSIKSNDVPLVSIFMITYNHEKYIGQALDSILMQIVDFRYEIVVGEDCSTDSTRKILISYAQNNPDKFVLFLHEKNIGAAKNQVEVLKACKGKYIAILEGDDYWTDPYKLQKQVEFLEKHTDCVTCFHRARVLRGGKDNVLEYYPKQKPKEFSGMEEILETCFMQAASVMFRRGLFGNYPEWAIKLAFGDWVIYVLNTQYGKIGYIDEVMSVYRMHPGGIWSTQYKSIDGRLNADKKILSFYEELRFYLDEKYSYIIDRKLRDYYLALADGYSELNQKKEAFRCLKKALKLTFKQKNKSLKKITNVLLKTISI